jgi:hypothetical protein
MKTRWRVAALFVTLGAVLPIAVASTDLGIESTMTTSRSPASDGGSDAPKAGKFHLPPPTDRNTVSCLANLGMPPEATLQPNRFDLWPQSYYFHEIAKRCAALHPDLAHAAEVSADMTEAARAHVLLRAARASEGWDFRCSVADAEAEVAFVDVWPRLEADNAKRADPDDRCLTPGIRDACAYDVGTWAFLKTLAMLEEARRWANQENEPAVVVIDGLPDLQNHGGARWPRERCVSPIGREPESKWPPGFVAPADKRWKRWRDLDGSEVRMPWDPPSDAGKPPEPRWL